jgi:hypothetical protein
MTLCIVAIFKNESHILKEWINHYIGQGVDKFFMIDNDSNDNYLEHLQPYINNNIVELVIDKKRYVQSEHYNTHFLNKCKKYNWVIVCDLDEFIYARKNYKTIKEYLQTLNNSISQVFIPWKIFGSNGFNTLEQEQPKNVIDSFTKRINYDKTNGFQGVIIENNHKYSFSKCIIRTIYLIRFNVHSSQTRNNNYITSDNTYNNIHNNNSFTKIDENILEKSFLHLNHYVIQSFNWFMNVKATRGDATNINGSNIRNKNYFDAFDICSNDIEDMELYSIKKL